MSLAEEGRRGAALACSQAAKSEKNNTHSTDLPRVIKKQLLKTLPF